MINKCRVKIVQRELYNGRDPPWGGGGGGIDREHCSNLHYTCT